MMAELTMLTAFEALALAVTLALATSASEALAFPTPPVEVGAGITVITDPPFAVKLASKLEASDAFRVRVTLGTVAVPVAGRVMVTVVVEFPALDILEEQVESESLLVEFGPAVSVVD